MTLSRFISYLSTLRNLEREELVRAGAMTREDGAAWQRFRSNPVVFLINADWPVQQAIWSLLCVDAPAPQLVAPGIAKVMVP